MTLFQRAATVAAMSLCLAGVAGISSPGFASEMDHGSIATSALTDLKTPNESASIKVPAPVDGVTPEVPGVTVQKLPADSPVDDEQADYASLAAAVAAQQAPTATDADLACLAGAIYFESKGEPLEGQLAVADVIINRAQSDRFPSSICGVVTQAGQFSFVRHGRIPHIDTRRHAYKVAMAVAQIALAKAWDNPAPEALFFHARRVKPGWGLAQVASIGHHVFYR